MSQQQQQQQQKQQAPESCAASVLQADGNFSQDLEWATKPPFALEDPSKPKPEVKYSGSCHCKEVTFELLNEPIDALVPIRKPQLQFCVHELTFVPYFQALLSL